MNRQPGAFREWISNKQADIAVVLSALSVMGTVEASIVPVADAHVGAQINQVDPLAPVGASGRTVEYGFSGLTPSRLRAGVAQAPPNSRALTPQSSYPDQEDRTIIHESNLADSEAEIKFAESNDAAHGIQGQSDHEAPIVVSTTITNADVLLANGGHNICDRERPNSKKRNRDFHLRTCIRETLQIEEKNLLVVMKAHPEDKVWTAGNEPEAAGLPTNSSEGGVQLAVKELIIANRIAKTLGHNQIILPGELFTITSRYQRQYMKLVAKAVSQHLIPMPTGWAVHDYNDPACDQSTDLEKFIGYLKQYGFYLSDEQGSGIWVTESGVQLDTADKCQNAEEMSNNQYQNVAKMTAATLGLMALAQENAAKTFMNLPNVDMNLSFHLFYYDPWSQSVKCWNGGTWDTALVAPNGRINRFYYAAPDGMGIAGDYRPAWDVLTNQAVPDWLLHPDPLNKTQMDLAKLVLIPAVYWQRGGCDYGVGINHKQIDRHTARHHKPGLKPSKPGRRHAHSRQLILPSSVRQ